MTHFDYRLFSNQAIELEYKHLELRANSIASSIMQSYGKSKKPIGFRFIDEREFNAFASLDDDGSRYWVEVNAAVPLLIMILFYRLLTDKRVLPYLDPGGEAVANYELPFILNPEVFDERVDWQVRTNAIRSFAAGTIADLCSTFVVLHEFGHIICGHTEGIRYYEKDEKLAELVSRPRKWLNATARHIEALERRKAWERDADLIGAVLLAQFVDELANPTFTEERTRRVFTNTKGVELEHTLAIAIAALFALFCYVQGSRRKLHKDSSHPHPHVRSLFVKDILVQELATRKNLNMDKLDALAMERLDEMMDALIDIELLDTRIYSAAYDRALDRERDGLETLHATFKESCARWRWFEW